MLSSLRYTDISHSDWTHLTWSCICQLSKVDLLLQVSKESKMNYMYSLHNNKNVFTTIMHYICVWPKPGPGYLM